MSKRSKQRAIANARRNNNIHHIYPQSRRPDLKKVKRNQVSIDRRKHNKFHQVFWNAVPEEVMTFLNRLYDLVNGAESKEEAIRFINNQFWGGRLHLEEGLDNGTG